MTKSTTHEEPTDHYERLIQAMREEQPAWETIQRDLKARCPNEPPPDNEDREAGKWGNLSFLLDQALGNGLDSDAERGLEDIEYGVLEGVLGALDEPELGIESRVPKTAAAARAWKQAEPLDPVTAYGQACDKEERAWEEDDEDPEEELRQMAREGWTDWPLDNEF